MKDRSPSQHLALQAIMRLPVIAVLCSSIWAIHDIASPSNALAVNVKGREIRIKLDTPSDTRLGRQLPMMPNWLPCSISINVDTRQINTYGLDGLLTVIATHEIGHCMEKMRTSRTDLSEPPNEWLPGWDSKTAESEAYADAWASLYLERCGVDMVPLGWPDERSTGSRTQGQALKEAQSCIPGPDEPTTYRDPYLVLSALRTLGGMNSNGTLSNRTSKSNSTIKRMNHDFALHAGLTPDMTLPPLSFDQASLHRTTLHRKGEGTPSP